MCVRDHRVLLRDVPLAPICEAYLNYLVQSSVIALDEAAAALTALAFLLERKAWGLLPTEEEEPEAEETVDGLPALGGQLQLFEEAIDVLKELRQEREQIFFRSPADGFEPPATQLELGAISSSDLALAMEGLLKRSKPDPTPPALRQRRSLGEVMAETLARLTGEPKRLIELMPPDFTRTDAVYVFLAVLELIRLGQVSVSYAPAASGSAGSGSEGQESEGQELEGQASEGRESEGQESEGRESEVKLESQEIVFARTN